MGTLTGAVTASSTVTAAGAISTTKTTESTTSTTGALLAAGGLGVSKKATVGSDLTVEGKIYATGAENTPATVSETCTKGEIQWDSDYIYFCVATDTWRRTALDTWS